MGYYKYKKRLFQISWIAAVAILLSSGFLYRGRMAQLNDLAENSLKLRSPLSTVPLSINRWAGKDTPISEAILQVAGNDDFINRIYINDANKEWAQVYVSYSKQPRTMLGHEPVACYVSSGWTVDDSKKTQISCAGGKIIPALIHRFYQSYPVYKEMVILNFYILNGQLCSNEKGFSGFEWRIPNIEGDPAFYVAQIQISAPVESYVLAATTDLAETIINFFPKI